MSLGVGGISSSFEAFRFGGRRDDPCVVVLPIAGVHYNAGCGSIADLEAGRGSRCGPGFTIGEANGEEGRAVWTRHCCQDLNGTSGGVLRREKCLNLFCRHRGGCLDFSVPDTRDADGAEPGRDGREQCNNCDGHGDRTQRGYRAQDKIPRSEPNRYDVHTGAIVPHLTI